MDDAEFDEELDAYLSGRVSPNPDMVDAEIVCVRGQLGYGADHIVAHGVTEAEVEEVLFEIPPNVRAKRHADYPNRTIFWGRRGPVAGSSSPARTGATEPADF